MKKLLTNGCSHTEGSECNVSFGDFFTNYEHVNIAKGGGGNERILRTTMEYCENNKVDLVIIGWSTHERFEFAWKDERKEDCQNKLWNSIDTSKYYKPHESFIENYMVNFPKGFSESKHITDEGLYKKIADNLKEMYEWRYYT